MGHSGVALIDVCFPVMLPGGQSASATVLFPLATGARRSSRRASSIGQGKHP